MLSEDDIWTEIKRMKETGCERWWDKGFQAKREGSTATMRCDQDRGGQ